MIYDNVIDVDVRQMGCRRGGQHAIMYWLRCQFDGKTYWENNASQKDDVLKNSMHPNLEKFTAYPLNRTDDLKCLGIFANYENQSVARIRSYNFPVFAKRYEFLVLRDPYNLFASQIKNAEKTRRYRGLAPSKMYRARATKELICWKTLAQEYLSQICHNVNYNEWVLSKSYRKNIVAAFPEFIFTDEGREEVSRNFPSSFDTKNRHHASEMEVLNRYKYDGMMEHPAMKLLLADEEAKILSQQIFGWSLPA